MPWAIACVRASSFSREDHGESCVAVNDNRGCNVLTRIQRLLIGHDQGRYPVQCRIAAPFEVTVALC